MAAGNAGPRVVFYSPSAVLRCPDPVQGLPTYRVLLGRPWKTEKFGISCMPTAGGIPPSLWVFPASADGPESHVCTFLRMLEASPNFQLEPQVITMTLLTLPESGLPWARCSRLPAQDKVARKQWSRPLLCTLIPRVVCGQPVRRRGGDSPSAAGPRAPCSAAA